MIQCPECRNMIPDDSAFCDQCGKELKWCPECKRPKRGTECPVCGNDLIPGKKYLSMLESGTPFPSQSQPQSTAENRPQPPTQFQSKPQPQPVSPQPVMPPPPQGTAVAASLPTVLVGNGWTLPLKEGLFGRCGGIWPELANCQYVSGRHGNITRDPAGWKITDIGSTNGTYINGARLTPNTPAALVKGNKVVIATIEFTVL